MPEFSLPQLNDVFLFAISTNSIICEGSRNYYNITYI